MYQPDSISPAHLCEHVANGTHPYQVYVTWFTGKGTECIYVCEACGKEAEPPTNLVVPTDVVRKRLEDDDSWEGVRGRPEVRHRTTTLRFECRDVPLRLPQSVRPIDQVPDTGSKNRWCVLLSDGRIVTTSFDELDASTEFPVGDCGFDIDEDTSLRLSPCGGFAAIYQTHGRDAAVYCMRTGLVTTRVRRGEYQHEVSRFPISFASVRDQTVLVVASDWNRLEVLDPASGENLVTRAKTSRDGAAGSLEHYLDYFHAGLSVSPGGNWIVDNGWAWHPVGIVSTWHLPTWLHDNVWESEDGPSLRRHVWRDYCWDSPICWLSDTEIGIWGWGNDDDSMIPAIRIFNVESGTERGWFAGPEVRTRQFPYKKDTPSLFFDEFLFAVSSEFGTTVWDTQTGERLHADPSLTPLNYHPSSREFISFPAMGSVRLSSLRTGGAEQQAHRDRPKSSRS